MIERSSRQGLKRDVRACNHVSTTAQGSHRSDWPMVVRVLAVVCVFVNFLTGGLGTGGTVFEQRAAFAQSGSKSELPRFASLKASEVNLRKGPGTQYPTAWVFRSAGMPVEIVREYEAWREIRDAEGTTGWVLKSLLSARRTAVVMAEPEADGRSAENRRYTLRRSSSRNGAVVAVLEPGVIADVYSCDGRWCRVTVGAYRGYFAQTQLWGVYPGERF